MTSLPSIFSGFLIGLSLIAAIGPQGSFVLRHGLLGHHTFAVCFICALSDLVLISIGVSGVAGLSEAFPGAEMALRAGGGLFLAAYGLHSIYLALPNGVLLRTVAAGAGPVALSTVPAAAAQFQMQVSARHLPQVVAACLAVTWLNPHVYLDTVLLLGSLSANYPQPSGFGLGAILASFAFFYSVGYGARYLRPMFVHPKAWRMLDGAVGIVMLMVAGNLLVHTPV